MTKEEAWNNFIKNYSIEVPEKLVEEEVQCIRQELKHNMRYDTMSGGRPHPFPELELEEQKEAIYAAAYRETKSDLVMKDLLNRLDISVTREELEAEAEAMARRQNTTVQQIKRFFGEDLAMLERDARRNKVMELVCQGRLT